MGVNFKDRWSVPSTAVAHEFIDQYMAVANGEYVKVYLFVLRHQGEDITIERIADALDHTESDVRRALAYWEKLGILAGTRKEAPASCAAMGRRLPDHSRPGPRHPGPWRFTNRLPMTRDLGDMEPMAPCPGKSMGRARESRQAMHRARKSGESMGRARESRQAMHRARKSRQPIHRARKSRQAMHRARKSGEPMGRARESRMPMHRERWDRD